MKFSIKEAYSNGWQQFKQNGGFLVSLFFILMLVVGFYVVLEENLKTDAPQIAPVVSLIASAVSICFTISVYRIMIKISRNQEAGFNDLFSCAGLFFKYVWAHFIYVIITLVGTLLLVIPGVVWAVQFGLYPFLVVDKGCGPVQALKLSSKITKGARWDLFLLGLSMIALNIFGALLLVVGLLITIPLSMLAAANVYLKLNSLYEDIGDEKAGMKPEAV